MDLIKINLDTIQSNPNAGNTRSFMPMGMEGTLTLITNSETLPKSLKGIVKIIKTNTIFHNSDFRVSIECIIVDKFKEIHKIVSECPEIINHSISITNNVQTIEHAPEPQYFFKREDAKVLCAHCDKLSDHRTITKWADDYGHGQYDICPHCGELDTFHYKFETIQEALERKQHAI